MRLWRIASWALLATALASCAQQTTRSSDPLTDFQDTKLSVPRRLEALDAAWAGSQDTPREEAREAIKAVAWSPESPTDLRLAALRRLLDDPESAAVSRKTARLMIPLEPSLDVVEVLGDAAAKYGWTEMTPVLVRSYARPGKGPDVRRPERASLLALQPGLEIEQITFDVFLHPEGTGPDAPDAESDSARRTRAAAWDLLGRLDADGSARASLLQPGSSAAGRDSTDRVVDDLRACLKDLRTVPDTSAELEWLHSLRDPADPANATWWAEAASAIAKLTPEQARGLRLRHAETVRWAGANRADWLAADRPALLKELSTRLEGRTVHQRQVRADVSVRPATERLPESESRLAWGDLVAMLVIDEALRDPALVARVFVQAKEDHADRTTEYGGLLCLPPPAFLAMSYPPRPSHRVGDMQFVASADMLDQGDRSAAHYHFHVSEVFNSSFSGPSEGDLAYAARQGRTCLVFTSLAHENLSVDYYQPDGVVVDLGELRAPGR